MNIDPGIVIAVLSSISTIALGLLQYRNWKSQARKEDTISTSNLVDSALKISKQEVETLKELNSILKQHIDECDKECRERSERIKELELLLENCEKGVD